MEQAVEKVTEPKLETFAKDMIDVQMKKLKALQRKSKKLEKTIREAKRTAKEKKTQAGNRKAHRAAMEHTVEKVMEAKLEKSLRRCEESPVYCRDI